MFSHHKFNEAKTIHTIEKQLAAGSSIGCLSDAGTPNVCDPGTTLLASLHGRFPIIPLPGPSALSAAISICPFNPPYHFHGFAPAKESTRKQFLQSIANSNTEVSVILFEAPHRISALIKDAIKILGASTNICIAREISKHFEQYLICSLSQAQNFLEIGKIKAKGEFVLILNITDNQDAIYKKTKEIFNKLIPYMSPRSAAKLACEVTEGKNQLNRLYQEYLKN